LKLSDQNIERENLKTIIYFGVKIKFIVV